MNFYKIRQKSTGRYFGGGDRFRPCFSEYGIRYENKGACTAALNSIERRRPNEELMFARSVARAQENGGKLEQPWYRNNKAEVDALFADNFEIVEFQEVEVKIIPKAKKK